MAKTVALCAVSFAVGAALFILSMLKIGWSLGEQIGALICFVTGIELTTRYIMTEYTYKLGGDDDSSTLSVVKKGGSREMTVCNIDASSIVEIRKDGKMGDFEKKYGKIDVRYNYCTNMSPESTALIYFIFNDKKVLLRIETDEPFFDELCRRMTGEKD